MPCIACEITASRQTIQEAARRDISSVSGEFLYSPSLFFFFFGVYELMSNVGSGNSQQKLIFMLQSEKKSQLYTEAMWELLVLVFGDLVKIGLKFDLC